MPRRALVEIVRSPAGTTRRDLVRALRQAGWELRREGARHEVWANGRSQVLIPRHRGDMAPGTVRSIAQAALDEEGTGDG